MQLTSSMSPLPSRDSRDWSLTCHVIFLGADLHLCFIYILDNCGAGKLKKKEEPLFRLVEEINQ